MKLSALMFSLLLGAAATAVNAADPYSPDTKTSARETAHDAKENAKDTGRDLKSGAKEVGHDIKDTTKSAAHETGEMISDASITTKVKASLLTEKNLKSLGINVDTNDGVVTLRGTVPTSAEMKQAEDVARGIKGVKEVHNELSLKAKG